MVGGCEGVSISFLVAPLTTKHSFSRRSNSVTGHSYLAAKVNTALGANVNAYQAMEPARAQTIPMMKQMTLQNCIDFGVGNVFQSNAPDQAPFAI
jgi:hypothetical protein